MSEYNDFFDFGAPAFGFDAVDSECPDQSAVWTAPFQHSIGVMEGDTAAQLQLDVDSAPSSSAEPLGQSGLQGSSAPSPRHFRVNSVSQYACAVCLELHQSDSAIHQHAIETQHKAYRCKCGTEFNKHSALQRHVNTKDAPKTFACTLCYDKFTRKDKLKDHCRHYHKITDQGLQFLFASQEVKLRAGVVSRRRRAPVRKAAASSGPLAPGLPPAHAPATAGPSVWSFVSSTEQQYAGLRAGTFVPTGPPASTSPSAPACSSTPAAPFFPNADPFAATPTVEDFSGLLADILGDDSWATGFDGFTF